MELRWMSGRRDRERRLTEVEEEVAEVGQELAHLRARLALVGGLLEAAAPSDAGRDCRTARL